MVVYIVDPISLYPQEALQRGVVVYLPEISCGGKPVTSKSNKNVCKDPVKLHSYNAIS